MSAQVFFRDTDGIIGAGEVINGRPVRFRPVDAAEHVELTYSHRGTTSSRKPGAAITGTVHVRTRKLVDCEKCHRLRIDLGGAHGPLVHPDGSVTDCTGAVVTAAWRVA